MNSTSETMANINKLFDRHEETERKKAIERKKFQAELAAWKAERAAKEAAERAARQPKPARKPPPSNRRTWTKAEKEMLVFMRARNLPYRQIGAALNRDHENCRKVFLRVTKGREPIHAKRANEEAA